MLTPEQIYYLLVCCAVATFSVVWLAIQQTLKWLFDNKNDRREVFVSDDS